MNSSIPIVGTWTFTHAIPPNELDIINGCYRPQGSVWYLQPFPIWTAVIIVPIFSTLSSLANLQPFKSKQLPVMVFISCCSYTSNRIANHYIFNRSDIVSAIGAFTVGLLGNVYSRKMGGTAFTSMVTGVLFLVPVCLVSVFPVTVLKIVGVVRTLTSRRYHGAWGWYRYWRCDDCGYYWYNSWVVHESSSCLCVRQPKECSRVLFLILFKFHVHFLTACTFRFLCIDNQLPNSMFHEFSPTRTLQLASSQYLLTILCDLRVS